ncbi:hypothetical protein HanRHA438_Chr13g0624651 [Helianthus annuus]|nr:hypothetical protein HanRHA438_Chr13g0624651 [Helianthus annuus]
MLCMPIVCILSTLLYIKFYAMYVLCCILSTIVIHHMLTFWYDIWFVQMIQCTFINISYATR